MRQNDSAYFLVDSKLFLARPGRCFRMIKCLMQLPFRQLILKVITQKSWSSPAIAAILSSQSLFFAIFHAI